MIPGINGNVDIWRKFDVFFLFFFFTFLGFSPLLIVRFTKFKKWHTQWSILYALPVDSYGHTALKGLTLKAKNNQHNFPKVLHVYGFYFEAADQLLLKPVSAAW